MIGAFKRRFVPHRTYCFVWTEQLRQGRFVVYSSATQPDSNDIERFPDLPKHCYYTICHSPEEVNGAVERRLDDIKQRKGDVIHVNYKEGYEYHAGK